MSRLRGLSRLVIRVQAWCFFCGKVPVADPKDCCAACGKRQRGER